MGCGGGPEAPDGGATTMDAATDAPECSPTLPSGGCPCPREGDVVCPGGTYAYRCLGGAWAMFFDGECWGPAGTGSLDAGYDGGGGPAPCDVDPRAPGCRCTCPQERACSGGTVSVHCIDGTWRRGWWECTPGAVCSDARP